MKGKTLFYLQMRSFHEAPGWEHFLGSLFRHLTSEGMSMRILCYKQKKASQEASTVSGSDMIQAKILNRRYQSNFFVRYLYECWLVIRAALHPKFWRESDYCLAHSFPSTFLCIWLTKVIFRKKVVYWIQDLWPENAVEIGALRRGSLPHKFFARMEQYACRKADVIVTISEDIRQRLIECGVAESKIQIVHNWSYSDDEVSIPWEENRFVELADLSRDTFYAVYAGAVGAPQNLELVVDAAALLADRTDIRFFIIGDGISVDAIKERARTLDNITFFPLQPSNVAKHIYSAASVNLITLKKGVVFTALPSKTATILACGRPSIVCVDTDSQYAALIRKYGVGHVTSPTDPGALADVIAQMASVEEDPDTRGKVRKCFEEQFSQKAAFERFSEIFDAI